MTIQYFLELPTLIGSINKKIKNVLVHNSFYFDTEIAVDKYFELLKQREKYIEKYNEYLPKFEKLSEKAKDILTLRYIDKKTLQEIADKFDTWSAAILRIINKSLTYLGLEDCLVGICNASKKVQNV